MKKIIMGLFCLLSLNARADVWECVAAGDVEIRANNMIENVRGRIGVTPIQLFQYGKTLIGHIEGLETIINLKTRIATGTVGLNEVRWNFNSRTGMITGHQNCLLNRYIE
jgi:hypothetical protein